MTHSKNDAKTWYELFQEELSESGNPLRGMLELLVQEILEESMEAHLNAGHYERTGERRGYRNGYKPRRMLTQIGRLDLQVPQDREGTFKPCVFEKYQRCEKAVMSAIAEMYLQGVSTRKVKKIMEELCGMEISKSQVSEITKKLDEEVKKWRERRLTKTYPYLVIDARYEDIRKEHEVVSEGVLEVIGIGSDGYREILGVWIADSENEGSWSQVFKELKERGLEGVRYVVSDDHKGLVNAIKRYFQGVLWQRCQVHFMRNILSMVRKKDKEEVAELLKEITNSKTLEKARENVQKVVEKLEKKYPSISRKIEEESEEILSVYHLPEEHRKKMRTTNMIERFHQELKRRTRVIRIFPNEASCLRIVSLLGMEQNEEWMERRYLKFEEENEEDQILEVVGL